MGLGVEQLDGDQVRKKQSVFLGYSREDRMKNVADVVFQASHFSKDGIITLVSLISPYRSMREYAKKNLDLFMEIYVRCPLSVCESRDVKGMYRLSREGKIAHFTGISDPYEEPQNPDLIIDTDVSTVQNSVKKIMDYLAGRESLVRIDNAEK